MTVSINRTAIDGAYQDQAPLLARVAPAWFGFDFGTMWTKIGGFKLHPGYTWPVLPPPIKNGSFAYKPLVVSLSIGLPGKIRTCDLMVRSLFFATFPMVPVVLRKSLNHSLFTDLGV